MKKTYWNNKAAAYDRHRKKSEGTYQKIIKNLREEMKPTDLVLDIGTGTGAIPLAIADCAKEIVATDYSEEMIAIARAKKTAQHITNVRFAVADCYELPFVPHSYDVVLAANIIHLLEDPIRFLDLIKKLLKPNGKLFLPTYMNRENFRAKVLSTIMRWKGHPVVNPLDSKKLIALLENNGFVVEKHTLIPGLMPLLFVMARTR